MIDAEQSDLYDVLSYISFLRPPISRAERVSRSREKIFDGLDEQHREFLDFVLSKYEQKGTEELDEAKLPVLLTMKYHALADAEQTLGDVLSIRSMFFSFQETLYEENEDVRVHEMV